VVPQSQRKPDAMPEEITRREILIGATTMAAAAALPQFSVEPLAATAPCLAGEAALARGDQPALR
jgi:hypothetical protein